MIRHALPGTELNGALEISFGEFTRTKHPSLGIHRPIHHFGENGRARTQLARSDLEMVHKPLHGALTEPWKLPTEESTRPIQARLVFHQQTDHLEEFYQKKSPPVRLGLGVAHLVSPEDICTLKGEHRPDQKELRCKTTWFAFLTHQRHPEIWNQVNIDFGLEVIQFLNQRILSLPYLEPHEFMKLQTYQWRPGDLEMLLEDHYNVLGCSHTHWIRRIQLYLQLNQPEPIMGSMKTNRFNLLQTRVWRPGELFGYLKGSTNILPCSRTHRIRRILIFVNLPFSDAFTLGAINHQRPYLCYSYDLDRDSLHLDVPRHHTFPSKLSRLKKES